MIYDYLGRDGQVYEDVYPREVPAITDFLQGGDNASIMELVAEGSPSPGLLQVISEYLGKPVKRPLKNPARDAAVVNDVKAVLKEDYPLTSSRTTPGAAEIVADQHGLKTGTVLQIYRRHEDALLRTFTSHGPDGPVNGDGPVVPLLSLRKS